MKTKNLVTIALAAAVICVLSPLSFQVGSIPITFATFAVCLAASAVEKWRGCVAVAVYIALGAVGMPVFSFFKGGAHAIFGLSGGYIIGYLPCALAVGIIVDAAKGKLWAFPVSMVIGIFLCYLFGTAWYVLWTGTEVGTAVAVCVVPFLLFDAGKIVLASLIGYNLRRSVEKI